MEPSADAFRALARSSPWRWRSLHFTHRDARGRTDEAWVRRPGELLVRTAEGTEHRVSGLPYSSMVVVATTSAAVPPSPPPPRLPHEVAPELRPDGLVATRPGEPWRPGEPRVDYDDPMWGDYRWVAMLDPVELSHHVTVLRPRAETSNGRTVWRADLVAEDGYAPRCGGNCCELLHSEAGLLSELDGPPPAGTVYPDRYDVALDVQTGIVVHLEPAGGVRADLAFTNTIHEVDADVDHPDA